MIFSYNVVNMVNTLHQSSTSLVRRVFVSRLLSSLESRVLANQTWVTLVSPRLVPVAYFLLTDPLYIFPCLAPVYMLSPPILIGALRYLGSRSVNYLFRFGQKPVNIEKHDTEQKNYILQLNSHHVQHKKDDQRTKLYFRRCSAQTPD